MSDLKNGDIVELECDINMHFPKGMIMSVSYSTDKHIQLQAKIKVKDYNIKKVGECEMNYETSNRKKLHDHIKASGYTSSKLGEVIDNKWHFSNITKKSRFDKFGDISSDDLIYYKSVVDSCAIKIEASQIINDYTNKEPSVSNDNIVKVIDNHYVTNNYALKQSNWITLNRIAFVICLMFLLSILTNLYFVVHS